MQDRSAGTAGHDMGLLEQIGCKRFIAEQPTLAKHLVPVVELFYIQLMRLRLG